MDKPEFVPATADNVASDRSLTNARLDAIEAHLAAQSQPAAEPVGAQPDREVPRSEIPNIGRWAGVHLSAYLRAQGMAIVYREGPRHD